MILDRSGSWIIPKEGIPTWLTLGMKTSAKEGVDERRRREIEERRERGEEVEVDEEINIQRWQEN